MKKKLVDVVVVNVRKKHQRSVMSEGSEGESRKLRRKGLKGIVEGLKGMLGGKPRRLVRVLVRMVGGTMYLSRDLPHVVVDPGRSSRTEAIGVTDRGSMMTIGVGGITMRWVYLKPQYHCNDTDGIFACCLQRRYYDDRRRDDVYYSDRRGSPPPRRRNEDDYYYSPRRASPPRRRRDSPMYDSPRRQRSSPPPPPPPRSHREQSSAAEAAPDRAEGTPKRDEADALLESVDSEARSVFVSQLAAALTSRDLGMFFEDKLGKGSVRDARVVTDRVTKRSKGIAYVELASVPLVHRAIGLTGTLVMGLPIMITFTESERNNAHVNLDSLLAGSTVIRPATGASGIPLPGVTAALPPPSVRDANPDAPIPYYRLYVGNLYYALTAEDLRQVFEPFGELSYVDLPMEPQTNRSRGYAFVQYKELAPAQMALQSMNGFELAGRSREYWELCVCVFLELAERILFSLLAVKVATVHPKGAGSAPAAVNSAPAPAPAYMPQQESSYRVDLDDREGELKKAKINLR